VGYAGGAFGGMAASAQSMGEDPDTSGPIAAALTNEGTDMAGGTDCQDLSADCKSWAMHGECERNVAYMVSPSRVALSPVQRRGMRSEKLFHSPAPR